MDAISYSLADKQAKRIKKIINEPDSTSGVVTVPKVIQAGETITIPTGRTAVLPNVQIDGTLTVDGDVFVPSGATYADLETQIGLKLDSSIYTASDVLDKIKTVDGVGSGLDADLVKGLPADFTASKATNGYQKLPNGIIIQWGVGTSTTPSGTHTFPISFPNSVLIAFGSSNYDLSSDDHGRCVMIYNLSNTGFTCAIRATDNGESQSSFSWIAIGY